MPLVANWSYPTAIRFGAGRIAELPDACRAAGIARPLLVTDRGLASLPVTARALDILDAAGLGRAIFADVDPNPTDANLAAGIAAFRAGGHDGVVAFGGGSGLDLGKCIAFMAGQTRPVWDFEDVGDWWTRADAAAIRPSVAVPTTAGTGSEVGRAAVITDSASHTKKVIFHPRMLPSVTICDPELTISMPPAVTAGTGMDALAHCVEAWCSPSYHPMSAGIALEGMRLVKENLPRAHADGGDLEARAHMMSAAAMGAVAFQKGLGAVHALSHPVGAIYGTHHGTTNAVVMPAVLRFNRPAIEAQIARAAAYLDIAGGFDGFVAWIEALNAALGIPARLGALGVGRDRIAEMAAMAVVDPTAGGNPVPLTEAAAAELYELVI
ncbi:MAG: alcohol dehydrogenase [Paracoccaceae bacterium]|nr:MAG: iron-containing alcohol dehydrogenase [Alphaproteobacteria bacterium]GIX13818.1 MAG: alcohol dehydrogenase [Paracoccaceae bacterium]